ncbi:MAG: SAM-dependent methyltransferase, partial [Telluria sp.]
MPDFASRDPLAPAFWDERFDRRFTPWERGAAPAALRAFVAQTPAPPTVLIPGCGTAHELTLMLDAGWDATAIDFSPSAV